MKSRKGHDPAAGFGDQGSGRAVPGLDQRLASAAGVSDG